jgi:hypothetical protein
VAAWPLSARAQQRAMPVIGLLSPRSPAVDTPLIAVLRQGLNETGLVEGQNVALDYRWAEGQYDRLAGLDADLVRRQVAVIVTIGGEPSALAAKAATATIPIVFANITGVSTLQTEMEPKRLELVRELRPHATTTAVLVRPRSAADAARPRRRGDRVRNRREFITLFGGAAAGWPFAARAQQTERMRRIGVLMAYGVERRAQLVAHAGEELPVLELTCSMVLSPFS